MTKLTLVLLMIGTIICGCERKPRPECEQGLCGNPWALELDSAVARGEARLRSEPASEAAFVDLADAYRCKAWFIRGQMDTRADFWLASNLQKVESLADKALRLCDKALQGNQNSARAYQVKGKILLIKAGLTRSSRNYEKMMNEGGQAAWNLEKAVALMPNSAEMWFDLAWASRTSWFGWRRAKECFKKAVELDAKYQPFTFEGPYNRQRLGPAQAMSSDVVFHHPELVQVLAEFGSWFDTFEYLQEMRVVPDPIKVPLALGLFSLTSDYSEAQARFYKEVVQANRHLAKYHLQLALACFQQKKPDTAEALKHFGVWGKATNGMGLYVDYSWWRGGRGLGSVAPNAYPSSAWAWIYAGESEPQGNGIEQFKKALALDPSQALPYYLVAASFAWKKDWPNAEEWLRETFRRAASDEFVSLNAHLLHALVCARTGRIAEVLREAQIAYEADSAYTAYSLAEGVFCAFNRSLWYTQDNSNLWFLLDKPIGPESFRSPADRTLASMLNLWSGWSCYSSSEYKGDQKFIPFFRKAIELDPRNLEAYIALASMYSEYVLRDEPGILSLQNVLRRYPGDGRAHRILADLYVVRNMVDDAKAELRKGYELGDYQSKATLSLLENWKAE